MEFKGQYLTYQEFKALGGTLDEMPFNLLEYNARKKIDERTFGRLVDKGQEYKEVKLCVYNMITTLNMLFQAKQLMVIVFHMEHLKSRLLRLKIVN